MTISGLKCDTEHCNYRDDSVKFEDYPKYINARCPICQSNLLTQQMYDDCVKAYKVVDRFNGFADKFNKLNPLNWFGKKPNTIEVEITNDGSTVKETKNKK